ncbi:hypothetical protein CXG81DRAFT_8667 [Caulochytrium protostelioides]|uniref:P-loop containing nucleoside triphosphate hydrolase protein n=1 Tax=Caulochytrium protostelioides TaxID=1555241 RepID=A0A4P9XF25_9FUNG|nr:hypothetical protein CXG81DRAFT_8667 [Caulochytrium protostelioides]|eukprot:RKP04162.1 hypothetical protein CXG81DRAFT_8667 [Caulochytrium protostelioides]
MVHVVHRPSYLRVLLRFATPLDGVLMVLGTVCAIATGVFVPILIMLFGNFINKLGNLDPSTFASFEGSVNHTSLQVVYLGIGTFFASSGICWKLTSETTGRRLREAYIRAVMRQDVGFFDSVGAGAVSAHIMVDCRLVQDGTGEKVASFIMHLTIFVAGFVVALAFIWKLALVLSIIIPLLVLVVSGLGSIMRTYTRRQMSVYARAADLAEETFSTIRTITAFMAQKRMSSLHNRMMTRGERYGLRKEAVNSLIWGLQTFITYSSYALGFWYGARLVSQNDADAGSVVIVFFTVLVAAFAISSLSVELTAFSAATTAASALFATLDREPPMDVSADAPGYRPETTKGQLSFKGIAFRYPDRPEVQVLKNFDLEIPAGTSCALVGVSGSGKSTIVALLERFYDPDAGTITLDGTKLQDYQLCWLRQQIGYVQQEPVLFGATVTQNVAYGLIGHPAWHASPEEQRPMIIEACKIACAHDFIMAMTDGYDTFLGDGGMLSGGQKQRVAIARAIIKNPRILLLDEATSALDTASEFEVQRAIDRAVMGRTTISVSHRLSTIRGCDNIVVMDKGRILEAGTHESLIARRGVYKHLVESQAISATAHCAHDAADALAKAEAPSAHPQQTNQQVEEAIAAVTAATIATECDDPAQLEMLLGQRGRFAQARQVLRWAKPQAGWLALGMLCSIVFGATQPVFAILFGSLVSNLFAQHRTPEEVAEFRRVANGWIIWFFIVAAIESVVNAVRHMAFGYASQKLGTKLRQLYFAAHLRQEIAWFDLEDNATGVLVSNLQSHPQLAQSLIGVVLVTVGEFMALCVFGIAIALFFSWRLGLVLLSTMPLIVLVHKLRMYLYERGMITVRKYYEDATQVACEAVARHRTVASLTREAHVVETYHRCLEKPQRIGRAFAFSSSFFDALAQTIMYLMCALAFWYGGRLTVRFQVEFKAFMISFMAIVFTMLSVGRIFGCLPDISKVGSAAANIFDLIHRKTQDDCEDEALLAKKLQLQTVQPRIRFENVRFSYPARPEQPILTGLDLAISPGQTVALVGPSGAGKSSIMQLLQGFYRPIMGTITFDGHDITTLDIPQYRSLFGVVSQEPNLFHLSIRDNIALGSFEEAASADDAASAVPRWKRRPTQAMIEAAAKTANIHDFIAALPQGYDTILSSHGGGLSGGQKQRLAIARALVRNPPVLLFDEATSALDALSERVVSDALAVAARGRTCISISHKIATVKDADWIYVLKAGFVAEQGTHYDLLRRRGIYFGLANQQNLS